jgi:predicted RNA-binding protein
MEIGKIISGEEEIHTLNILTNGLCVFNLETTKEGVVLDGKFNVPGQLTYIDIDNNIISWEFIEKLGKITFKEHEFKVEDMKDPEIEEALLDIISMIPVPDLSIKN